MKIVFANDFSDYAQYTLSLLEQLHLLDDAELTMLHVLSDYSHFGTRVWSGHTESVEHLSETAKQRMLGDLDSIRAPLRSRKAVVCQGHPAHEICQLAGETHADVVALGARGRSAIKRFLLGSVAHRVSKHAPCSVLLGNPAQHPAPPKKVVVGFDGSPNSQAVLERLKSFQLPVGQTQAFLVTTYTKHHVSLLEDDAALQPMWQSEREAAEEILGRGCRALEAQGLNVVPEFGEGNPANEILHAAEANSVDLICLGKTGHGGIERYLLGSIADRVLRHAECSVWLECC